VKERIVIEWEYKNLTLEFEDVASVEYRPIKRKRSYRLVILRKTIMVKEGQKLLVPDISYFFYLTNDRKTSDLGIVFESNDRCNQENLIGQLKSGMDTLRMPLDNLYSNLVCMIAASLAWTLKSWSALFLSAEEDKQEEIRRKDRLLRMEFTTFLQAMVAIPAQILRSGRRTIIRFLNINDWTETFFRLYETIRLPQRE
jgi:hypothetical protein